MQIILECDRKLPQLLHLLFKSIVHVLMNHSDSVAYFFGFCAHASSGSLTSMVYPIAILCYALAVRPRPSRHFWEFMVGYSAFLICIKFFFWLRIWCQRDQAYELGLDDICNIDSNTTAPSYMESTYVLGVFPGKHDDSFLSHVALETIICFLALVRQSHLVGIGQWRAHQKEHLNKMASETPIAKLRHDTRVSIWLAEVVRLHSKAQ